MVCAGAAAGKRVGLRAPSARGWPSVTGCSMFLRGVIHAADPRRCARVYDSPALIDDELSRIARATRCSV
jgi:hypothetical protein